MVTGVLALKNMPYKQDVAGSNPASPTTHSLPPTYISQFSRPGESLYDRRETVAKRSEIAVDKFRGSYNCAQSVLYSFCDDLGLDRDTALKMACGFGAGMSRRQEVCGAISGGILAIGLKHGRGEGQEKPVSETTYSKVRELISRFEAEHSAISCRELLEGCDLNTPEGQLFFKESDLLNRTCVKCVRTVVETLEELL